MEAKIINKHYTYTDYITWDDDIRYELIDGVPYMMASPSFNHQAIVMEISRQLGNFLHGKQCRVFVSPFDVRLNADDKDDTVVQPDILVVCDHSKFFKGGCKGSPDVIIEVLSPSSASKDKVLKFNKYLQAGVKEYWIVEPDSKVVSAHVLKDGDYIIKTYDDSGMVPVSVLDGCEIDMVTVFSMISEE